MFKFYVLITFTIAICRVFWVGGLSLQ